MWAAGCVMGEVWGLSPLFPGETDLDQLRRIFAAVGTPDAWLAVRERSGRRHGAETGAGEILLTRVYCVAYGPVSRIAALGTATGHERRGVCD